MAKPFNARERQKTYLFNSNQAPSMPAPPMLITQMETANPNSDEKLSITNGNSNAKTTFQLSNIHWTLISCCLAVAISVTVSSFSHTASILSDLTNGIPLRGELGYGKFLIYGTTIPFEYPFRLSVAQYSAWFFYIPHQLLQFYIIYNARKHSKWSPSLNVYAKQMFLLNFVFVVLHFIQSHLWYDGLAGSFPEISTLFAGVSSLLAPFIFQMKNRGVAFHWKTDNPSLLEFFQLFKEYHGYLGLICVMIKN
jgi:hypothetical protein